MRQQHTAMSYSPATGERYPYPSNANEWRRAYGRTTWTFNPWSGKRRMPEDVKSDPFGFAIIPPGEEVVA